MPIREESKIVRVATCLRCKGEWEPKTEYPSQCPICKSRAWDKERVRKPRNSQSGPDSRKGSKPRT